MTNEFEEPDIDVPTPDEVETEMLIRGDLKEDARQIPQDKVTSEERRLIRAYLNDYLAEEDYSKLRELLRRYRPAIMEHQPEQTLENVETNLQQNTDEKRLLDIIKQQKHEKTLTINYPLDDGTKIPIRIGILKADSQYVLDLQTNYKLFADLNEKEDRVRLKNQQGSRLTPEEKIILDSINQKVTRRIAEHQDDITIDFLSWHTYLLDEESTPEYMRELYTSMDETVRDKIYARVSRLSGLVSREVDDLFQ